MIIIDYFLTVIGLHDGNSRWYLWWSGMFGNIVIFAAAWGLYRKHNCHIGRCWRIGHHEAETADGDKVIVCRHHHPGSIPKRLRPEHLTRVRSTERS